MLSALGAAVLVSCPLRPLGGGFGDPVTGAAVGTVPSDVPCPLDEGVVPLAGFGDPEFAINGRLARPVDVLSVKGPLPRSVSRSRTYLRLVGIKNGVDILEEEVSKQPATSNNFVSVDVARAHTATRRR